MVGQKHLKEITYALTKTERAMVKKYKFNLFPVSNVLRRTSMLTRKKSGRKQIEEIRVQKVFTKT